MANADLESLFADDSPEYIYPWEPEPYSTVALRLRTGKEGIVSCALSIESDRDYEMTKVRESESFRWYEVKITLDDRRVSYHFTITLEDGNRVFYTRRGVEWSIERPSYFNLIPGFKVPRWMCGAVTYQIYVDRFCNGDPSNDVLTGEYQYLGAPSLKEENWGSYPKEMDVRTFYGGDLKGVIDKLDYLKDLGVEVIYFNPLFVSPSNHKYDAQDYFHIDPHIGRIVSDKGECLQEGDGDNHHASRYIDRTINPENLKASDDLFAELVARAHARGIRVIIDGVFNHCGSFNRWLDREGIYEAAGVPDKGAYLSKDSPYRNFFRFNSEDWPNNGSYDGWWGHETLPKLNYEQSRDLVKAILEVGRKWVLPPYNADGYRLDVAADLGFSPEFNHWFWGEFRKAVKRAKPDAIILAENYGDSSPWLQGKEWDTIMNYDAFMEPVTYFLTGMEKHSDDRRIDLQGDADHFWKCMTGYWSNASTPQPMYLSMNQLSNHDHSRFLTRTNHMVGRANTLGPHAAEENVDRAVMREAVLIQFTWKGAPTLYYGDEAGVCGFTDPDNRRTYPWGHEDLSLLSFHKDVIRIHKSLRCLSLGSTRCLALDRGVAAYGRFGEGEVVVTVVNNNPWQVTVNLPVYLLEMSEGASLRRGILSFADNAKISMDEKSEEELQKISKAGYYCGPGDLRIDIGGGNILTMPEETKVSGKRASVTLPPSSGEILVGACTMGWPAL